MSGAGVLADEVARFDALADRWWDPRGPMRGLHAMNPARIGWVDGQLRRLGLGGVDLLDVGCGAGIAAESLAELGYKVLGLDAAAAPVAAARAHAPAGLDVAYRTGTVEGLREEGARFGAITALEVIEHVADAGAFVRSLAGLLRPGGVVFISTLNRTAVSYAAAKVAAEYVLRMLPVGTHDWRRFVAPTVLAGHCRAAGLRVVDTVGLNLGLDGRWRAGGRLSVNYMLMARLT